MASINDESLIKIAKETLAIEKEAIGKLEMNLGEEFINAVYTILNVEGNVIFSGVGKSGHIAKKLAATFSSTGTTSFFVHADEAAHGDLGMVSPNDVFIALSFSGESDELLTIIPALKAMNVPIISITGRRDSSLAKSSTVSLITEIEKEACPLNLAPTASTTAAMALGDALASALIVAKGFKREDFAKRHPAGALGRRLILCVTHVMRKGKDIPVVKLNTPAQEAIKVMAKHHLGSFIVVDECNKPVGVFTEGDLCRKIQDGLDLRNLTAEQIMTRNPKSVKENLAAYVALQEIKELKVNQLVVTDEDNHLVGILHIQDLIASRLE